MGQMNILLTALTAPMVAWFAIEVYRLPERIKRLNFKPFNCVPCLSVWTALGLYFAPNGLTEVLFVTFGAGCVGAWLSK